MTEALPLSSRGSAVFCLFAEHRRVSPECVEELEPGAEAAPALLCPGGELSRAACFRHAAQVILIKLH